MEKPKPVVMVRPPRIGEPPLDDGYSWILVDIKYTPGANYQRNHYRCVHHCSHGCMATKQVQSTDDDPMLLEINYDGWHTCVTQEHVTPPMPLDVSSPSTQTVTPPSTVQVFPMRSTYEHGACSPPQEPQDMGHSPVQLGPEDFLIKAGVISEPAGSGASAYSAPTAEDAENPDVQAWGVDQPFHNFFETPTHSQAVSNGSSSQSIRVGDDTNARDCVRTKKRLSWTKEEDLILVSAWLSDSNDPTESNYKKNDQFWEPLTAVYNKKVPKERARKAKQVKDRFEKIKKALKTYEQEHKNDGPFMFKHCWEVLHKEPKWYAYLERLRDEPQIGCKQAKKQQKHKRKEQASVIDLEDEHHEAVDSQNTANEGRKEMLKTYGSLLMQDTTRMSEEERTERVLALRCFREHLFGKPE